MPASSPVFAPARNALIFRSELLSYSETFIPGQAEKFQIFTPFYAGFKSKTGAGLPHGRTVQPHAIKLVGRVRNLASIFGIIDPWFENAVRKIHPELIHAHFEEDGLKAVSLAERLKAPLFITCHGYDVTVEAYRWQNRPVLGKYYQSRRSALFKTARLCLGVSRFICDQMLRRGYPAEKIRLHYIGVDTENFCPDTSLPEKPMILFVGRLVEKKGCADLLKAMVTVTKKFPEIELVVIGSGSLGRDLEGFARENKINVRFAGIQSQQTVVQYLRQSLFLCCPSVRGQNGDCEGLPMVVVEAQSMGKPVVGTHHAGIPEAVEHGVTGLLSAERDPDALAGNMLTLLSDTALRASLGQAGRNRMVKHFDRKKQSQILEQIYLEFL